jgi:hypothetical protein
METLYYRNYRSRATRLALAGAVAGLSFFASSGAVLAENFFSCTPQEVAVFPGSRIHVLCAPADGQIAYFALSVGNPDVSRVLSLAETAVAGRRPLTIEYDPTDLSGAQYGCLVANCRAIQGIFLTRQ